MIAKAVCCRYVIALEQPNVDAAGMQAVRKAQVLSLRVLAERLEHGEPLPQVENVFSIVA